MQPTADWGREGACCALGFACSDHFLIIRREAFSTDQSRITGLSSDQSRITTGLPSDQFRITRCKGSLAATS